MYFKFNTNQGEVRAWVDLSHCTWVNGGVDIMAVNGKDIDETRCDTYNTPDGDLAFKFNGEEVLIGKAVLPTMAEIKQKLADDSWVTSEQLVQAVMAAGMENVKFSMEMEAPAALIGGFAVCNGRNKRRVDCKIVPMYNRMPHGNYKLKFEAVNNEEERLCREEFYTSDMIGLIKRGFIQIGDVEDNGKTSEQNFREYIKNWVLNENFSVLTIKA